MRAALSICLLFCLVTPVSAQMDVWLDFGTDWLTNLDSATASAGVDDFSAPEIAEIETTILGEFGRVYADFDLTFFSSPPPPGVFTTIDFGATTGSSTLLGSAPGDAFNTSIIQTADVYTANFGFTIDEFSGSIDRMAQIEQFSVAIASTAIHELGHSIGMFHKHAYGTPGITPSTYGGTMGLQNANIMGTGPTGIDELGRETPRTLSQFSQLVLEAAGGLDPGVHGTAGVALAPDVVLMETEYITTDAGASFATATPLALTDMPISGFGAANVFSDITSFADSDFFSLTIDAPGFVSADLIADETVPGSGSFDGVLTIFDPGGIELFTMDDTAFDGDVYNMGTFRNFDPFIANFLLPSAGTYFLVVSHAGSGSPTGDYNLLVGVRAVPEPGMGIVFVVAGLGIAMTRRRSAA